MAGTKRERKLRRIERRGQRLAEKVMSALGRMGETEKLTPCGYFSGMEYALRKHHQIDGILSSCAGCQYQIPHGEGCSRDLENKITLHWPQSPIPDAQWRKYKNWEFDRWKQRTRKQKRSCRP